MKMLKPVPEIVVIQAEAVRLSTAAAMAEVCIATIYNWVRSGKLKTIRIGKNDQRILVDDFRAFLRNDCGMKGKAGR